LNALHPTDCFEKPAPARRAGFSFLENGSLFKQAVVLARNRPAFPAI